MKFDYNKFLVDGTCTTVEGKQAIFESETTINDNKYILARVRGIPQDTAGESTHIYTLQGEYVMALRDLKIKLSQNSDNALKPYEESFDLTTEPVQKKLSMGDIQYPKILKDGMNGIVCFRNFNHLERNWDIIDFDVKLSNGMNLQRGLVWTLEQKQKYILSIINKYKVDNNITMVEEVIYDTDIQDQRNVRIKGENQTRFRIIDGKQRLNAFYDYCTGKFPLVFDGNEYYIQDLSYSLRSDLLFRTRFEGTIIYTYSEDIPNLQNNILSDKELVELFNFINFIGTPQDSEHLQNLYKSLTT
ncbi:MAG: hypothetical protein ACRDD8_10545 [Bacteroidales bacterium]